MQLLHLLQEYAEPISDEPIIGGLVEDYPAYNLELKENDRILEIDNQKINTWEDIGNSIKEKPNLKVPIKWLHNDAEQSGMIKIAESMELNREEYKIDTIGIIGIIPKTKIKELGILESYSMALYQTKNTFSEIQFTIVALIMGNIEMDALGGPVRIAGIAGQAADQGLIPLLYLMAVLSINLAFLNILPIPGLDGGHVFITLIEGLIERELSIDVKMRIQQVGVLLILGLFVIIMYNDISRLLF